MAKVTYINSILSGKLGGLVYAFNKAGNYVKTFRSPTNPNTTAQLNNRASFTEAVTSWHGLQDEQKAAWNVFAVTNFKPKFGSTGVRFSGFNAYVSCHNVVNNMNRQFQDPDITIPAGATATYGNFVNVADAPSYPLSSMIQDGTGNPMGVNITSVALTGASGLVTLGLNFTPSTGPGPVPGAPSFVDSVGSLPVGIAVVASLPIVQDNQYVENPEINLVAIIPPPTFAGTWGTGHVASFDCPALNDYNSRKFGYKTGDLVQYKAYLVGENGMTQPLNTIKNAVV